MNDPLPNLEDYEISPKKLQALLEKQPSAVRLIDCREVEEFDLCRLEGADLIPLSQFGELAPGLLSGEQKPIVIY